MAGLTRYRIDYRQRDDNDATGSVVSAFRVEGWSEDYAFFANPANLAEPTLLVPRELVFGVSRLFDADERQEIHETTGGAEPWQN